MGVWVGERTKTIVIFLTGSIPEGKFDVLAVNLDVGDVVLEDGGDVDLLEGERVRRDKVCMDGRGEAASCVEPVITS